MDTHYTIIIPHYNNPRLLKRCLMSIPIRKDTQVIVVDDRSNEDSLKCLKKMEFFFPHVSFIYSQVNGGGGKARNIGLNHAIGKYILFADADDFFNYCVYDILDKYLEESYDLVFFNALYLDSDTYLYTGRNPILNTYMKKYEKDGNVDTLKYLFGEPWCKLIRRGLIEEHKICFSETSIHNDARFSYLVGYYSKNVKVDNIGLYCLADRGKSVSKSITDEKMYIRMNVFSEKNRFLTDHHINRFDNFMIVPIERFILERKWKNLKNCFKISAKYGFSIQFVLWRLILYEVSKISKIWNAPKFSTKK